MGSWRRVLFILGFLNSHTRFRFSTFTHALFNNYNNNNDEDDDSNRLKKSSWIFRRVIVFFCPKDYWYHNSEPGWEGSLTWLLLRRGLLPIRDWDSSIRFLLLLTKIMLRRGVKSNKVRNLKSDFVDDVEWFFAFCFSLWVTLEFWWKFSSEQSEKILNFQTIVLLLLSVIE